MAYSEADREQVLEDIFNPDKITLWCEIHSYFGPSKTAKVAPNMTCHKCWMVYYIHDIATTPASQRAQRIDELEQVIHHMVETVEAGKWDFNVTDRPQISVRDESEDDSAPRIEIIEN